MLHFLQPVGAIAPPLLEHCPVAEGATLIRLCHPVTAVTVSRWGQIDAPFLVYKMRPSLGWLRG